MTTPRHGASARTSAAVAPLAIAVVLVLAAVDLTAGAIVGLLVLAALALRTSLWVAVCALAWAVAFLAVLYLPGPYDSWAGRAAIPVLAVYAMVFLAGWLVGRALLDRFRPVPVPVPAVAVAVAPVIAKDSQTVWWPSESRLRGFLLVLLAIAVVAALFRFRGAVPPLFSPNPDVARELLRYHTNIFLGLLWEAWTLGVSISLFRLLAGPSTGRWFYLVLVAVFGVGSALGASKNSVLIGVVAALVAALSVRQRRRPGSRSWLASRRNRRAAIAVVLLGVIAVGTAAFLGGQRTLAGTGNFEDHFRGEYGSSPITASVASLDLSLSASGETFGRLWADRGEFPVGWGRYSLIFSGSPGQTVFGAKSDQDLYGITSQLSQPYYMNTATFVAIPLLDFGMVGAAVFLLLLGLLVGAADRRLERSTSPGAQLGRAFIVYFAAFGVYELYPLVQPTWLATVPGLVVLHLLSRPARRPTP
jgi:oligosaccharide repeat unit polymerase